MTARALVIAGATLVVVFVVNAVTLGVVRASTLHLAERVAATEAVVRELRDDAKPLDPEAHSPARTVADR